MRQLLGYLLVVVGVIVAAYVFYAHTSYYKKNRTFSPYSVLTSSWGAYKTQFINKDGRVIDGKQNQITTSEGQSYAMLRSVWVDDKETFDLVWKFTKQNMKRRTDNLLGWKWGKLTNGKYGFLPSGGINSASDADQDTALALILANGRWHDDTYVQDSKKMLDDIWKYEVATSSAKKYLTAGNWASGQTELIVNPSYFAPYAWRIFAKVDTKHPWNDLVDPAYKLLEDSGKAPLDKEKGVGLPPDWIAVDKKNGSLRAPQQNNLKTDYGYDAIRVPWRIALDYQWNRDPQAKQYLESSYGQLVGEYSNTHKLAAVYSHDGGVVDGSESPSMYATVLGAFMVANPDLAKTLYDEKIIKLYVNDRGAFNPDLPYYEQNWVWFAVGLYNRNLSTY